MLNSIPNFAMYELRDQLMNMFRAYDIYPELRFEVKGYFFYIDLSIDEIKVEIKNNLKFELVYAPKDFRRLAYDIVVEISRRDPVQKELKKSILPYFPTHDRIGAYVFSIGSYNTLIVRSNVFVKSGSDEFAFEIRVKFKTLVFLEVISVKLYKSKSSENFWRNKFLDTIFTEGKLNFIHWKINRIIKRRDISPFKLQWDKVNPENREKGRKFFSKEIMDAKRQELTEKLKRVRKKKGSDLWKDQEP